MAIDFGTHGSGFAFATVSPSNDDPRERTVLHRQDWPKAPDPGAAKDLSAVVVDENLQPVAWGYTAYELWRLNSAYMREEHGLRGYAYAFKMALSTQARNRAVARREGAVDLDSPPMLRRLIASMLRYMRDHALDEMRARNVSASVDEIRWCITVPAIWSDAQKQIMRNAAEEAGLGRADEILIAIEPESAAVYGILNAGRSIAGTELRSDGEHRLMVVDCGGGTVDISAFSGTVDGGRVRLAEIGPGSTGAALGSQYINHAFRTRLLPRRLDHRVMRYLEAEHSDLVSDLETQFEKAKLHVGVRTVGNARPQIPGPMYLDLTRLWPELSERIRHRLIKEADGDPRTLFVTAQETQELFDEIVDPLVALVRRTFDDLRAHVGDGHVTVLLVGGFAFSDYLRARIGHELDGKATVLRPTDPRHAVLDGAVHFCYDPTLITQRRARQTYGFQLSMPYRSGTEDIHHELFFGPEGRKWIRDRFQIAVRRSQAVELDQPYRKVLTPSSAETPELRVTFFASRESDPQYVTERGVFRLGEIIIDIRSTVGRPPADRQVKLEMTFGDTVIRARATALDTGAVYNLELPFDTRYVDAARADALDLI